MMEVRQERTGWRDEGISRRHRLWGYDCPALDIDFLMIEYDRAKAVALVEYKREGAGEPKLSHPTLRALKDLADRAGLPAFVCYYAGDFDWWFPIPLNYRARLICPGWDYLKEHEWAEVLYRCRGRQLPLEVIRSIAEASCN